MPNLAETTAPVKLRNGLRDNWDKSKWGLAWLSMLGWFAIIETLAVRAGKGTLSEFIVRIFRTDTQWGQLIFMIFWGVGSMAMGKHIIDFGNVLARLKAKA
jgi:hypothetical protein